MSKVTPNKFRINLTLPCLLLVATALVQPTWKIRNWRSTASQNIQNYSLLTAVRSILWKNANDCLLRQTAAASSPPPVMTTRCRVDNLTAHPWFTLITVSCMRRDWSQPTTGRWSTGAWDRLGWWWSCPARRVRQPNSAGPCPWRPAGPARRSVKNREHRWTVARQN
jgi:hypothetical protein